MATPENVGRVKMAGQTKSMIANGKLPASWLNSTELALRHNPAAAARLLAVGNRMQQNPVAAANKLEAIQRGIVHAARMKSIATAVGVAGAATVAAAALAAMSSKAKAEPAKPAAPPAPKAETSKDGSSFNASAALWSAATLSNVGAMAVGLKMGSPGLVALAGASATLTATLAASSSAKAEPAKPVEAPKPSAAPTAADNVGKAIDAGFATAMTAKAVQLMANPAVRAGASILSKAAVPLTIGAAAIGAYQGYQKDGLSGIALGAADGVTGGGVSAGLAYLNSSAEKKAAAAPAPIKAPAPQAAQGGSTGGEGGMKSYTTADGRSVQGTAAQIASWEGRKK